MTFLHLLPRLGYLLRASLGSCVCLLAALLLISCSSTNPNPVTLRPTPPTATAASTAPATVATGPAPVTTPLAAPPQNCSTSLPPQHRHLDSLGSNSNVHLLGGGPFWIIDGFYQRVFHTAQHGNQQKMVVEVGPNYDQPVTLRLRNTETGALVWWTGGPSGTTAQTLVLKPQEDKEDVGSVRGLAYIPHGESAAGWKEWGLFPVFSAAGCYSLEVSWANGSWQSRFAVGN